MFNGPTRTAVRQNLVEFGAVLAGRGPQINAAIGQLRPLLRRLEPVARESRLEEHRPGPFLP